MNTRRTRIRHRKRRRGSSRLVVLLFSSVLALGFVAVGVVVGWIVVTATTGPKLEELKPREFGSNSQVLAADGTRLGFLQSWRVRQPVASNLIPDHMRDATVAVEDRRFYEHQGVDFEGVVRAAFRNVSSGKTVEGGSTLTMQLIRALYADDEKSFVRKIREAKLAEELENKYPGRAGKRKILNQYLNNVPYGTAGGQEVIGIQAAARAYYGKKAKDLSISEAAMLAGLPQAPTSYNPLINPDAALKRRNDVLNRMQREGMITDDQAAGAKKTPIGVKPSGFYSRKQESYVFDYIKKELVSRYGSKMVSQGGLKVYTTIDLGLQRKARAAMANTLPAGGPSAAIVSVDPKNGRILAMASSSSYGDSKFNLAAQARRQPGSTFKIMTLMAAVRAGANPDSTSYVSKPLAINDPIYGKIETKTYDGTYSGSMSLRTATLKSDNSVYMQLALDVGPDKVKRAAVDMGIPSRQLFARPSESLGGLTNGITPLEAANAYATIASGGYRNRPTAISRVVFPKSSKYPEGKVSNLGSPKRAKTFSNGVTGEVTKILAANVTGGTGGRAQMQCPAAGKTGTTDSFKDAWFSGFSPNLATSVWVGYPVPREMRTEFGGGPVAGGSFPAEIWGKYMRQALAGKDCGQFRKITEPISSGKFNGRYARSGGKGTGDDYGDAAKNTSPGGGNAVDGGVKKPTSNGGGGNGGGNGNNGGGNGGGNPGGGNPQPGTGGNGGVGAPTPGGVGGAGPAGAAPVQ